MNKLKIRLFIDLDFFNNRHGRWPYSASLKALKMYIKEKYNKIIEL